MARAGQHVEQCFGNAEASHGGLLFQGHVNGSFHIHHETQAKQHAAQRIIPFPRNEDVVDRYILAELDQLLPPSPDYQSAALWGLGGSGKTQIALEYAYRRSRDPACSVFWVHADNETTFTQDYKVIAKRLGLADGLNGPELLMAVRERIEASPCWLLILDNADNLAVFGVGRTQSSRDQVQDTEEKQSLYDFVPRGPAGTVLWTSRDKRISGSLVGGRRAINVASMTEGEAKILLETVMCREIAEEESHNAMALLAELDLLPLAVSQAAAYMGRTATPIGEYLSKLKRRIKRWQLLSETEFDRHRRADVSNSVMQTWGISIEHIRQENQMAYNILHSLAFLDNQNIPLELVAKAAEIIARPTRYEKTASAKSVCIKDQNEHQDEHQDDDNKVLAAIVLLQHFSFLHPRTSGERYGAYEMHKLVQEATQYSLSQEDRRTDQWHFSEVALRAATSLFPERRRELWGECERYLRHAQLAAGWAGLCRGGVEAAALLTRVSDYLYDRGRWGEREPVDLRAYEYRRELLGDKHPDTIRSMAELATTYHAQGRYKEAEKISVEVLALRRDVLGDKHPDTIWSMAELATTYHAQGRYKEAEKISVEVLALRRDGRYKEAEKNYMEVLALRRDVLGDKHPDTIWSMASLATTYHAQGRYEEAEKIKVEVLVLQRDVLGDKHPDTIRSMASLATTYHAQGRYEEAEKISVEVLVLQRDVLGDKHPDTIRSMAELATTYHAQGRYEEAEKIKVEVLVLQRDVLGDKHPDTIRSMASLATTYHAQGRYEEAEKIKVEVLVLQRDVLGDKHPDTIRSMASLATTYHAQGRYEEAEKISVEVLVLQRDVLGDKHPDTIRSMAELATTYHAQGRCWPKLIPLPKDLYAP
ncbi:NB-ARC domain and tetratricopeptide repeat-containing NOD-like receptor [Podospora pseudopauciseta]|uniref:NB-ARC domain and tetratricopeptide repeat-containing NOD-like receptor n=1 Tax=Podospora pseudopauciseta TaxID=2093780 RepID=A0ABR0HI63_9PEZI|nr:NB-ARC domain and tetratricopeptide repeat-containing NOD-like receptor [Podospora pseudopauciseta]